MSISIKTRDFGELTIEEDKIINFPNGIFAFSDSKKFVILSPLGDDTFPMWLQSLDDEKLCFIVYSPAQLVYKYSPKINIETIEQLNINENDQIDYLVIAVVPTDFKKSTVNLKSPIIINRAKGIAAQIIVEEDFQIKFPIFNTEGD